MLPGDIEGMHPTEMSIGYEYFSIIRKISGIGFQPVELKMTGWKPIPRKDATLIFRTLLSRFDVSHGSSK